MKDTNELFDKTIEKLESMEDKEVAQLFKDTLSSLHDKYNILKDHSGCDASWEDVQYGQELMIKELIEELSEQLKNEE